MSFHNRNHWLNILVIVVVTSLIFTSVAELVFGIVNISVHIGVLAVILIFTCLAVYKFNKSTSRSIQNALQYIERLCQLDPYELADSSSLQSLPILPSDPHWKKALLQISNYLVACSERLQAAEIAKTNAEVRARRLIHRDEQANEIINGLVEPVIAIDHYDELLLVNMKAEELLGIDPKNCENRALSQLVHCEKLVELLIETRQHLSTTMRSDEIEVIDGHGEKHWFNVHVKNIPILGEGDFDGEQANHGAVAMLQDIGTQKAIQKRNAEFVSSVSHEMKTPLAGIKAYVELLADGEAEDENTREEFLDVINNQANRLQRLIDNLLNLARIEAGVVEVNKEKLALNEILEDAFRITEPAAEQKGIKLSKDLSTMYLGVLVDRDMILQSVINLLSNAIKYTSKGGSVALRSRLCDDQIQIEVEDSGVGLSEEDSTKIFEKFYRVKKNHNMAPGTGLGLPLARHIVEDVHGGKLTVASQLNQGSKFQISLSKIDQVID